MIATFHDDEADERARIDAWLNLATKPPDWRGRDTGDVISDRQSRGRWSRGEGLLVRVPDLAWVLAWVDAALSCGETHQGAGLAQFETRWLRALEYAEGRTSLSSSPVPPDIDRELRRELLGPDVEDLVLGYAERSGEWVMGYAGLSAVDAEAFRYSLELRGEDCHQPDREHRGGMRCLVEIRDMVDRRRGRKGMPLAVETVENRLSAARTRLRRWAAEIRSQGLP